MKVKKHIRIGINIQCVCLKAMLLLSLPCLTLRADPIIYGNPANTTVNLGTTVYIDFDTGATATTLFTGADVVISAFSDGGNNQWTSANLVSEQPGITSDNRDFESYVQPIPNGAAIGPDSFVGASLFPEFIHHDSGGTSSDFTLNQPGFFGVQFTGADSQNHFGWVNATPTSTTELTLNSFGYETAPDTAITAQAPEPATTSVIVLAIGVLGYAGMRYKKEKSSRFQVETFREKPRITNRGCSSGSPQ